MTETKARQRILVVDDEEDVQVLLAGVLTAEGYEVDLASDGGPAIEKLGAHRPDLVILDLMMPKIEGWAVLEYLRGQLDAPPVVVLTARGDYGSFARSVREGIAAYVIKPFGIQELVSTCARVLSTVARRPLAVSDERRRESRRPLLVEVKVLSKDRKPFAKGDLVNLSGTGARVDLETPLELGERVRLAFHIPGTGSPTSLEGEIRWRSPLPDGFAFGLAFSNLTAEEGEHLSELLRPPA